MTVVARTGIRKVGIIEDDKGENDPAGGPAHGSEGQPEASATAGDLATLDAALGLGVRVVRERIETCATLMGNAGAVLGSRQEALAIDAILDAEPLLLEAQTIPNATTMLRRVVREAETAKT